MARKINFEELAKNKEKARQLKAEAEAKNQKRITEKSAIYKKTPGKILWGLCLLISIFSATLIADNWIGTSYSQFDIKDSAEDKVGLIKGGYVISSTFNWVYLNDNNSFGMHIHHKDFEEINKSEHVNLGHSKIFNVPDHIKYTNQIGLNEKIPLESNLDYSFFLPLFLLIFSGLWLFAKPTKSMQWIMYGYIMMVILPIGFSILILKVFSWLTHIGLYEIQIGALNL
jgi:hypothetical protein